MFHVSKGVMFLGKDPSFGPKVYKDPLVMLRLITPIYLAPVWWYPQDPLSRSMILQIPCPLLCCNTIPNHIFSIKGIFGPHWVAIKFHWVPFFDPVGHICQIPIPFRSYCVIIRSLCVKYTPISLISRNQIPQKCCPQIYFSTFPFSIRWSSSCVV
jgi:hypothetical protein